MGGCISKPVSKLEKEHDQKHGSSKDSKQNIEQAQIYYNKGYRHFIHGKLPEAIENFQKALELNPSHYRANLNLGDAFSNSGQEDISHKYFEAAVKINPESIRTKFFELAIKDNWQNSDLFQDEYPKLLDLPAKTFDDYWVKFCIYIIMESGPEPKIKALKAALELEEDPRAYYELAQLLYDDKNTRIEALNAYRKATECDPEYASAWYGIASVSLDLAYYEEAVKAARKTIELEPKKLLAHVVLGRALYYNGQEEEAFTQFSHAFKLYSSDSSAHLGLTDGNIRYIKRVFADDRVVLIEKMKQLAATKAPPLDVSKFSAEHQEEVKKVNEELERYQAEVESIEKVYVASWTIGGEESSTDDSQVACANSVPGSELSRRATLADEQFVRLQDRYTILSTMKFSDELRAKGGDVYRYYDGLSYTFNAIYTSSQVVSAGKHSIDSSNFLVQAFTGMISLAPFGSTVAKVISTVYEFAATAKVKRDATKTSSIASNSIECNELIMHLTAKLVANSKKLEQIRKASTISYDKGIFATIKVQIKKVENLLNDDRFDSPEAKLGREDGLLIIKGLCKGELWRGDGEISWSFIDKMYDYVLAGGVVKAVDADIVAE